MSISYYEVWFNINSKTTVMNVEQLKHSFKFKSLKQYYSEKWISHTKLRDLLRFSP